VATIERLGDNWVIVRGHAIDTFDETGDAMESRETASSSDREFWIGKSWLAQYGFARQFATREEAQDCIRRTRAQCGVRIKPSSSNFQLSLP
jgi:hypothetical protein